MKAKSSHTVSILQLSYIPNQTRSHWIQAGFEPKILLPRAPVWLGLLLAMQQGPTNSSFFLSETLTEYRKGTDTLTAGAHISTNF